MSVGRRAGWAWGGGVSLGKQGGLGCCGDTGFACFCRGEVGWSWGFEACLGNGSVPSSLGRGTSGCWTQLDPDGICGLAQSPWTRTLRALGGTNLLHRKGSCFV